MADELKQSTAVQYEPTSQCSPWGASKSLTSAAEMFLGKDNPLNWPGRRQPHSFVCQVLPAALEGGEAGGGDGLYAGVFPLSAWHQLWEQPLWEYPAPLQKGLKHPPSSVLPCSWEKQQLKLFCEVSFSPSPSMKTPATELQASAWAGHKGLAGL